MFRNMLIGRQKQHGPREIWMKEIKARQWAQGLDSRRAKHLEFEVTTKNNEFDVSRTRPEVVSRSRKKKCTIAALSSCLQSRSKIHRSSQQGIYGNHKYIACVYGTIWKMWREQIERSLLRGDLALLPPNFLGSWWLGFSLSSDKSWNSCKGSLKKKGWYQYCWFLRRAYSKGKEWNIMRRKMLAPTSRILRGEWRTVPDSDKAQYSLEFDRLQWIGIDIANMSTPSLQLLFSSSSGF